MNKKLNNIYLYYLNLRKDLFLFLIICICYVFLYDFTLINIPEIFKGASIIGNIFYKLCFAYVTAYIFYFLNIYIKSQKDKEEVNFFVASMVKSIEGVAYTITMDLLKASNVEIENKYPNQEEFDLITSKLLANGDSPLISKTYRIASWSEYLNYQKLKTEKYINKTLTRSSYLDSKLIGLLSEIEDCDLFFHLEYRDLWGDDSYNLSFISPELYKYIQIIEKLNSYYNDKLSVYILKKNFQ